MRTQVAIIGAGPAGLLLAHLLHLRGIESVVLESQQRDHIEGRIRAGALEQTSVELLCQSGVGERLKNLGLRRDAIWISFKGRRHRIDLAEASGGRALTIYGQQEVVRDLIRARMQAGRELVFDVRNIKLRGFESGPSSICYETQGVRREIHCDFIAGCDGFHGMSRPSIVSQIHAYQHDYPFYWLSVLVDAPLESAELVYTRHERGFMLHAARSSNITRLFLQIGSSDTLADWPDDRIGREALLRSKTDDGWTANSGRISQKSLIALRSFVAEPMQCGNLFLAGDAAHIVPPVGAKGMNLALADAAILAHALGKFYSSGQRGLLDRYSETCLQRVWNVQRFSAWMTCMLHPDASGTDFDNRRQVAELDFLVTSKTAKAAFTELYVGLPLKLE